MLPLRHLRCLPFLQQLGQSSFASSSFATSLHSCLPPSIPHSFPLSFPSSNLETQARSKHIKTSQLSFLSTPDRSCVHPAPGPHPSKFSRRILPISSSSSSRSKILCVIVLKKYFCSAVSLPLPSTSDTLIVACDETSLWRG